MTLAQYVAVLLASIARMEAETGMRWDGKKFVPRSGGVSDADQSCGQPGDRLVNWGDIITDAKP